MTLQKTCNLRQNRSFISLYFSVCISVCFRLLVQMILSLSDIFSLSGWIFPIQPRHNCAILDILLLYFSINPERVINIFSYPCCVYAKYKDWFQFVPVNFIRLNLLGKEDRNHISVCILIVKLKLYFSNYTLCSWNISCCYSFVFVVSVSKLHALNQMLTDVTDDAVVISFLPHIFTLHVQYHQCAWLFSFTCKQWHLKLWLASSNLGCFWCLFMSACRSALPPHVIWFCVIVPGRNSDV